MNRKWIIVFALAMVALIVIVQKFGLGPMSEHEADAMRLYGNVDIREVDMAFRTGGRVATVPVEEGDRVSAGTVLAALDSAPASDQFAQANAAYKEAQAALAAARNGPRRQQVAQAEARVKAAEIAARNADREVTRQRPLVGPGAISRAQWEQTLTAQAQAQAALEEAKQALSLAREGSRKEDIEAARARVQAARAARDAAGTTQSDTRLEAASDGVVVTRAIEPGAIVQPGQTALVIAIDRPLRIRAYVSEEKLSSIRPGMKVDVTADGNDRIYRGTIGYISPRAEFTPRTVETEELRSDLVYRLRIVVNNPDGNLRQGQPVTINVRPDTDDGNR